MRLYTAYGRAGPNEYVVHHAADDGDDRTGPVPVDYTPVELLLTIASAAVALILVISR